jgi:AraC-like DNA-binding protein
MPSTLYLYTLTRTACEILDPAHFSRQYCFLPPAAALGDYIYYYWMLDLGQHTAEKEEDYQEFLLANINSSLVFNLGSPFEIRKPGGELLHRCTRSAVISHHDEPVLYRHFSGNFLVGIKFRPLALSFLFRTKAASLLHELQPIEQVFRNAPELEERLHDAASFEAIKSILDEALCRHLNSLKAEPNALQVFKAFNQESLDRSHYRIKDLAALLYVSPRTLERHFSGSFELSPKKCLRILRFRRAVEQYCRHGYNIDWEELGYYDFSHFRKDWKAYTPPQIVPAM